MTRILLVCLMTVTVRAEVRTLTLRQAVAAAVAQNPDVVLARLDERKAAEAVRLARDPFSTRVVAGSGLAYSSGFPMSIEGSAPSIVQVRGIQTLYDRQKRFELEQVRENARGAAHDVDAKRDEAAFRTASLYLDAEQAARALELVRKQSESLGLVAASVGARVQEGRELPIENKRAALSLAQARQSLRSFEAVRDYAEQSLALVLGFGAEDRVRPVPSDRELPPVPESESDSVGAALASNPELRRLTSALLAKEFELKGARSARYPKVDLVAQYALFGKFNNYEDFFARFERHNWQLGASIQLPILPGSGAPAQAARAQLDMERLRTEIRSARDRITVETRRLYRDVANAAAARDVARLDLDVARDQLTVALAQHEEGRAGLREVEQLRSAEAVKWIAFYEAQGAAERARWALLRQTGELIAAIR